MEIPTPPTMPPRDTPDYWKKLRNQWLIPDNEAYCNTGTIGILPTRIIHAMTSHIIHSNTQAAHINWNDDGKALLSGYAPYTGIREKIADLINTDYTNVALTQNATMGMNLLANGLTIPPEAEIITTNIEHPGGKSAWELHSKRHGTTHTKVKIPDNPDGPAEIIAAFEQSIIEKTRVISFPHISSEQGTVFPARELCQLAKEHEIFTIIDGAQTPGHIKIDVNQLGCDAYYGSPHKWLMAPAGNGFLYIHPEKIDQIWATLASSQWNNHTDNGYRLGQRGTGNPALLIGLEEALDFHQKIGPERVYNRIKQLGDRLRSGLMELPKVQLVTPPEMAAGLTTFKVKDMEPRTVQETLWNKGRIQPRALRENWGTRYSTHVYNNEDQIDRSIEIIANL